CFFHQKTQNELSKELGISPSAVSRTLSRAMNRMRRYYADVRSGGCNRKEIR
ncbi:sigma factor-like helix-turn-helix DNA-binding protein, partial [Blautia wexlerae]